MAQSFGYLHTTTLAELKRSAIPDDMHRKNQYRINFVPISSWWLSLPACQPS
jgi:hypothetical protein